MERYNIILQSWLGETYYLTESFSSKEAAVMRGKYFFGIRKDFFSELNDSTKEQSRLEVLTEMGLDPLDSVPKDQQVEFVQKHKERHKELLEKRLKEVKE